MQEIAILKKIVGEGKVVETHASAVLITSEHVYKIKKPVYFGFLDYRQLKQRRGFCILEKELNSRYCDGIYMSVFRLTKRNDGYELLPLESSISAIEYVLQMRRIPDEQFLNNIITGDFKDVEMDWVGTQIGEKLALAERSPEIVENMNPYEMVSFNAEENFQQLKAVAPDMLNEQFHFIEKITKSFLAKEQELIERRYKEGFVKDGHGDLRLEHIFIKDDVLGLIDCIEFNTRFRTNDVVSEAAFLSMELDYFGRLELSDAFLKGFFKVFPDQDSRKILNFYRCYRAMVRAKVAVLTMLGAGDNQALKEQKAAEYYRMIDMATVYAMSMFQTTPFVFCGTLATGKSSNAKRFAQRFPVFVLNTDEVRKNMTGLELTENAVVPVGEGIYAPEITSAVYSEVGRRAKVAAKLGRIIISDGTFRKKENRDEFEKALTAKPIYICFTASDEVIKARLQAREQKVTVTDGRIIHFEEIKATSDFECTYSVNTEGEKNNIEKILSYLIK